MLRSSRNRIKEALEGPTGGLPGLDTVTVLAADLQEMEDCLTESERLLEEMANQMPGSNGPRLSLLQKVRDFLRDHHL